MIHRANLKCNKILLIYNKFLLICRNYLLLHGGACISIFLIYLNAKKGASCLEKREAEDNVFEMGNKVSHPLHCSSVFGMWRDKNCTKIHIQI